MNNNFNKMPDSLLMFKNKQVLMHLRTGKDIVGVVESVTQFNVIVTINKMPAIVMKHAIDYMELNIKGEN